MIFIYAERRSKTRALHLYYLQNSLSFVENLWTEAKFGLQIVTSLRLRKCRIFCGNSLTNNDTFFQLMLCRFVEAVRQTTGHYIAWGLYYVLVLPLEEHRSYGLEAPIKCLHVVTTWLTNTEAIVLDRNRTTDTVESLVIETHLVMLTSVKSSDLRTEVQYK
jgi:hypothetical protein